jgi:F420-dependent oxidoreductase-like protein
MSTWPSRFAVRLAERMIAPQVGNEIMKLGLLLGTSGARSGLDMDVVLEAERLGFDSAWAGEAYGSDAVTPIAWMLARTVKIKGGTGIMQMPARTPACAAMTAMSLQALSGGRFLCGLGPSGPQVVEGWHGQPFGKPHARTREYVSIIRQVFARTGPLVHQGEHYQIPYTGAGATGLGKPLKSIMHPSDELKIYTAAISPAGLRTAGEVADGVLPFIMSPERADLIVHPVEEGMGKASARKTLADFDIAPYARIRVGEDVAACRDAIRPELAFYIGGMGARDKNFYNDLVKRMGYEAAAREIQDLFLSGKRQEATAAVPDALIDETCLVGPKDRIKDRLEAWKAIAHDHKIGTLLLSGITIESARIVAEAVL